MKDRQFTEQHLQKMLHALPDRKVPGDLADRIMAEIEPPRKKAGHFLSRLFTISFTFEVRPLRLAGAFTALAAVFLLGLIIGGRPGGEKNVANTAADSLQVVSGNAEASHMMGRALLAGGQAGQALEFLRQASLLAPQNPEYALWEGVALGRKSNTEKEREVYRKIIRQYPRYLPARMYLGHNLLETGQPAAALAEYERVLALYPGEETALYNRALACQLLGNREQEAAAWKDYLHENRQGKWAYRAVEHLNALGDFTFRSYQIGFRKIILNHDLLLSQESEEGQQEADFLAASFIQSAGRILNLVVFQAGDADRAEQTALLLQDRVAAKLNEHSDKYVHVSWFGNAENVHASSGKQYQLNRGLLLFSQPHINQKGEKTI